MTWSAPRTWVVGEAITFSMLNLQIRDDLLETMAAKAAAAGDLFQGTGANTLARIARSATVGHAFQILTASTVGWAAAPSTPVFGAGSIALYPGAACPSGWAEVTGARGRMIVGLPAGGTLAGTVGSALTDLGTRIITTIPAHTHDAGSLFFSSSLAHSHTYPLGDGGGVLARLLAAVTGGDVASTSTDGAHGHSVTGAPGTTGVASVDVTNPYIQYLVCRKT